MRAGAQTSRQKTFSRSGLSGCMIGQTVRLCAVRYCKQQIPSVGLLRASGGSWMIYTAFASPMASPQEKPWHEAYPAPATPAELVPSISCREVLSLLNTPLAERKFILIDLRRADHVVGPLAGPHASLQGFAINL
jgi:hypothetical protein